ncbi:MAG: hypothetical protein JWO95_3347 [Verrucomicrobiales bacterium]|nr:hypothetical protein [Verrucomicrobiales bacterium]
MKDRLSRRKQHFSRSQSTSEYLKVLKSTFFRFFRERSGPTDLVVHMLYNPSFSLGMAVDVWAARLFVTFIGATLSRGVGQLRG